MTNFIIFRITLINPFEFISDKKKMNSLALTSLVSKKGSTQVNICHSTSMKKWMAKNERRSIDDKNGCDIRIPNIKRTFRSGGGNEFSNLDRELKADKVLEKYPKVSKKTNKYASTN